MDHFRTTHKAADQLVVDSEGFAAATRKPPVESQCPSWDPLTITEDGDRAPSGFWVQPSALPSLCSPHYLKHKKRVRFRSLCIEIPPT